MPAVPDPTDRGLTPLRVRAVDDGRVIDLTALPWCDPVHLTAAAALAAGAVRAGVSVRVAGPADPDTRSYVGRMRLGVVYDELGVDHDLPRAHERDRRADLLEVRPVRDESDAVRLARLVSRRARQEDADAGSTLFSCLVEMALNVAEHSGVTGYVAAQTLPRQGWMRFAVADAGVGLRASLAGRGAVDDRTAVRLALAGTSRFAGPERGTGLPTTRRELVRSDGWLLLASGTVRLLASGDGERLHGQRPAFPGTIVQGALRIGQGVAP